MRYIIEVLDQGQWTPDGIGEPNAFEFERDAEVSIVELRKLGQDWAEAEYRVVEA